MVKISRLDDAFLEVFELQESPVEGQSLQQKEKKKRKRNSEKKISTDINNKDTLRNMGSTIQLKLRQMQDF